MGNPPVEDRPLSTYIGGFGAEAGIPVPPTTWLGEYPALSAFYHKLDEGSGPVIISLGRMRSLTPER